MPGDIWGLRKSVEGLNDFDPSQTMTNSFENFEPEFGYGQMRNSLDDLYDRYNKYLGRSTQNKIADNRQSTSARMASEGISGGSFVTDAINKGENQINQGYFDAMSKMNADKAGQNIGLMDRANRSQFDIARFRDGGNRDQAMMELRKLLGLGQVGGNMFDATMANSQEPGWLEDVLAIANTASGFIPGE